MLEKERLNGIIGEFSQRLKRLPFSDGGIPSHDETQLTKDIWTALTKTERYEILNNTQEMVAEDYKVKKEKIPDQTPYAMRLTHKYLKMKAT